MTASRTILPSVVVAAALAMATYCAQAQSPHTKDVTYPEGSMSTGVLSQPLPSNHALIITVSNYKDDPLPGVIKDRDIAREISLRLGVPPDNIDYLSDADVTIAGIKRKIAELGKSLRSGDRLYIHYSGHGGRIPVQGTNECTEGLITQDYHILTKDQLTDMLRQLTGTLDKTFFVIDACHSGGVVEKINSRGLKDIRDLSQRRARTVRELSFEQCAKPDNFTATRGVDLNNSDHNIAILSAAKSTEVAWDTVNGGDLSYNMLQCMRGEGIDVGNDQSVTLGQLQQCIQKRLDASQPAANLQHPQASAKARDLPLGFNRDPAAPSAAVDTTKLFDDILAESDDRWQVALTPSKPVVTVNRDDITFTVTSKRDGYVYLFYQGSQKGSFYLLFPNALDQDNRIARDQILNLPRPAWTINALGPAGVDHLLLLVSETPRDFTLFDLPKNYVSQVAGFTRISSTAQAERRVNEAATLSAALNNPECKKTGGLRDFGVAKRCSNVFGAAIADVEERN